MTRTVRRLVRPNVLVAVTVLIAAGALPLAAQGVGGVVGPAADLARLRDELGRRQEEPQEEARDAIAEAVEEQLQELERPRHFEEVPSRWYRAPWDLLPGPAYEVNEPGDGLDPYRQNVLKGDFPILGEDVFLRLTVTERMIVEGRGIPTQAPQTSAHPGGFGFFGEEDQLFFSSKTAITLDLFRGQEAFKPVDWRVRITPVFDATVLSVEELGNTNVSVGDSRTRVTTDVALQEALVEVHLADLGPRFDFLSLEAGILPFRSDFRGFLFDDTNLGVRLFGNADQNKWQFNLAYFSMLEKDTNSELNDFDSREQQVLIANVYRQDFIWPGYNVGLSVHWNHDEPSTHFNDNGFLARPQPVGLAREKEVDSWYLGFVGDGHLGPINVTHAFYQVLGSEENDAFAGRDTRIDAQLFAIEASIDVDWWRFKLYAMIASGDSDPADGVATGFDAIQDLANFAGGEASFFMRQQLPLLGVALTPRFSFLPDLTTSRLEGQANHVNPGLVLLGASISADLTPTLRAQIGFNDLRFEATQTLERYLETEDIASEIGREVWTSAQWRPLLTNNVVVNVGASLFFPGDGFAKIYQTDEMLWSAFVDVIVTW